MHIPLLIRRLRQIHLGLGIIIGGQIGLWLISGLFMTWFSIDLVRGEHLRVEATPKTISIDDYDVTLSSALESIETDVTSAMVSYVLDKPVWRISTKQGSVLIDAKTGETLSPISEVFAREIATDRYAGTGQIVSAQRYEIPPREYGGAGPVWRIEFSKPDLASFYVDASTAEVRAVRTTLWRVFDFMWGLHIMDWSTRENFNSWWIKTTAVFSVLFFFVGISLIVLRVRRFINHRKFKS